MNWRMICAIVFCLMFWACVVLVIRGCLSKPEPVDTVHIHVPMLSGEEWFGSEEYVERKRLHRYHGCDASWEVDGKYYFERDGREVELWDPRSR